MAALPILVKHRKVSDKADGQDPTLLQPSDWNKEHVFKVDPVSLVGNLTDTVGDATSVGISDEFKFEDGKLSLGSNFEDAEVVVSVDTDDFPGARVLTPTSTVTWDFATAKQAKANVPDKSVTLAKMELSPAGSEILYYDKTSKAPVRLSAGTAGMVLKTGTVEVAGPPIVPATNPSWGFTGAPHAVLQGVKATGVAEGTFTAGAWRQRLLATEVYDLFDLVLIQTQGTPAVPTNRFRLVAGTYIVKWSAPAYRVSGHQSRLFNFPDSVVLGYGMSGFSENSAGCTTTSSGIARFTIVADKNLEIQHWCDSTRATEGFGNPTGFGVGNSEIYTQVEIWRES